MSLRQGQHVAVLAVAGVLLALTGCTSECGDLDAQSAPLANGDTVQVEVEVVNGRLAEDLDVHGGYYQQPRTSTSLAQGGFKSVPSPFLRVGPGKRPATVRKTPDGLLLTLESQSFLLDGPLRCE